METTEKTMEVFSGFNSVNPEELLKGLMNLFNRINKAEDVNGSLKEVASILQTAEFVAASNPALESRVQVITRACLAKLAHAYSRYPASNAWIKPILDLRS